ncbi:hypothetical protein GGI15_003610 [Coemansia interrupta]|uniref:Uncharacterized protein n=1 Tax=Coemansia interrupta TaxID=1126814 RepID=A0A9W8LG44_9FUNG|nr:hypothetical protein GGI15_003610 [Coemansia interrupta]
MSWDSLRPAPPMQAICAALCLLTLLLSVRTIARFRRHLFEYRDPASESPTLYLLCWLAAGDIVTVVTVLCLLFFGSDIAPALAPYLDMVVRAALAAQICYHLVLAFLAVHVLAMFGIVSRHAEASVCDYYGPAAASLALALSYKLVTSLSVYPTLFLVVIPTASMCLMLAAAVCASALPSPSTRLVDIPLDDPDIIRVRVAMPHYVRFAQAAAGLHLLFHLPWLLWAHLQTHPSWLIALAYSGICARGIYPAVLTSLSPALTMQVVDDDADPAAPSSNETSSDTNPHHAHQD